MGLRAQSLLGEGDLLGRVERGAGLGETPPLNPTQVLGRRRFDGLAAVAWVHFLALDLFVGRWVYLDARARGLTPWLTSP